ncbi:MAG: ParB N-terminal domain-containing protein [Hyphomicrobiaceae bacterium]|nr:ParB N-terminal domain-containing protein [Hyphomicrobiaceae bacterium]
MPEINAQVGKRPTLEWVPVEKILVDHNYQREIRPHLVERILANFAWDHFGAVVLAPQPDGTYHVTDGQHRVKAASLHPNVTEVPALVIAADSTSAEAKNFLVINRDRQAVNAIDRYWAGIAAGDPDCLHMAEVLKTANCDVVPSLGEIAVGLTASVYAVQRALARHGDKAVTDALTLIRRAWPDDAKALRGTLILALARLFRANPALDRERMRQVLAGQSFAQLTAHAEGFRKLSGGSAETALSKTISELYNKGLSKNIIYFGAAA